MSEALRQAEARNKGLGDELKEANKGAHGTRQELANVNNTISNLQAEKTHNQGLMKSLEAKLQVGGLLYWQSTSWLGVLIFSWVQMQPLRLITDCRKNKGGN